MKLLLEIKPADAMADEDIVFNLAMLEVVDAKYKTLGIKMPDHLSTQLEDLGREAKSRHRDMLHRALAQAKLKVQSLKSREQRLDDAKAEIERLEAALKA